MTTTNYRTRDISVAAFLMASSLVKMVDVERSSIDSSVYFHFQPKEIAEKLVIAYWAESVTETIQPKKLLSSLRDLKDILFGGAKTG